MDINLEGFDDMEMRLSRLGEILEYIGGSSAAKSALKKAGDTVVKDARSRLTPQSKRIRPSIQTYIQFDSDEKALGELGISYKRHKKARHAHLVENGHRTFNGHGGPYRPTSPHPFWQPALKAKKKKVIQTMVDITAKAMEEQWRR